MSANTQSLTFQESILAELKDVYRAFTNQALLNQWLCNDAHLNARENGRLYLYWNQGYYAVGEFTGLEENKSLAFTWQGKGETAVAQVNVTLVANDPGTTIHLTHDGLGPSDEGQDTLTELSSGWQNSLANLKSILEHGLDKRIYDLPMLGVIPTAQISAEQAAALGMDSQGGIRISGTVPNSGAARAGLQPEDIITRIGDTDITRFQDFAPATANRKVEDTMQIDFYRDNQKQSVTMQLSPRPAPSVPATAADFAEQVRQLYAQLDSQLDELLADVSEEEASAKPSGSEWSIKEILGHLILSERGSQFGLAVQLNDQALTVFANNPAAPTTALIAVYPTLAELLQLWQKTDAETIAFIANLPEEFVSRKVDYLNSGLAFLMGLPNHTRSHFRDIERVLNAIRKDN